MFGARSMVGRLVSASIVKELGPVLTALMVAGRVGSGIAAELGSMMVTDQIAALRALGTDPIRKLVLPRILAGVVMVPILTVICERRRHARRLDRHDRAAPGLVVVYWNSVVQGLYMQDVWMGLIKPFFLGFAIVSIGCHVGLRTRGGTQGVGRATTNAVVASSVAVHRRRLPGHAGAHRPDVLMAITQQQPRPPLLDEALAHGGPIIVFDGVHLAFDDKVILNETSASRCRPGTRRSSWAPAAPGSPRSCA